MHFGFKLLVVLAAISALTYFSIGRGEPVAAFALEANVKTNRPDECANAERCLYVYVAPWCPTCTQAIGLIDELKQYCNGSNGKVGMKIIVGKDESKKLRSYGGKFSGRVYFDESGEAYDALGVTGVPGWVVVDKERVVRNRFAGTVAGAEMDKLVDVMIDEKLALSDFL